MIPRRTPLLASAAAAGALALSLAGCTGSPEPEPTPSASADKPAGVTDIDDAPGSGEGLVGALEDLEIATCERQGDKWSLGGTVTNSATSTSDYRIYISLLDAAGDTRGLTQIDVDGVAAGASDDWSESVDIAEDDLSCVPRVERYEAGAGDDAGNGDGSDG
ncbi:hypothetical protein [Homoserinibacter sp. YIM 151385]|uniref:hypothetical protein n=1 Tax=Homoserinibacter sp. YIM 151385 TaxID=2985506 RepID=UPI0022F08406|nr:hypothetical protein [Homoserinibacter sp. YIM 151385]WBU37348.1 hypothetical protein OF852_10535 [Homoserinibacter sp. YIM 151385]